MTFGALVVLGYLLGSCPWGYWLVRVVKHEDIRRVGSGNIGATNVWRTYGRWLGAPVVLLDTLKGFVPALFGMLFVSPHHLSGIVAGAAAMLGHWRPLFLRFAKGGKMVATCGGVFFGVPVWGAPGALASGWCGGGETATDRPDIVTGQQVHAVVAVPSDGGDNFLADAGKLSDDVTSMVTWWQSQDATRIPRFDQASFGTTGCLD